MGMIRTRPTRVANRDARHLVAAREEFQGIALHGMRRSDLYVVFLYGPHFPMLIHTAGEWYENADRDRFMTDKNRSPSHRLVATTKRDTQAMKALLRRAA